MSFRSNNETALDAARKFRGGGHKDAAGGRLATGAATSVFEAVELVGLALNPPKAALSQNPFAALQNFKA